MCFCSDFPEETVKLNSENPEGVSAFDSVVLGDAVDGFSYKNINRAFRFLFKKPKFWLKTLNIFSSASLFYNFQIETTICIWFSSRLDKVVLQIFRVSFKPCKDHHFVTAL